MFRILSICLVLTLTACKWGENGDGTPVGGSGGAACQAESAAEFFAALAGTYQTTAEYVDGADASFVDGNTYTVVITTTGFTISTETGDETYTFDAGTHLFEAVSNEVNIGMFTGNPGNIRLLLQQDCSISNGKFFINYSTETFDYTWNLDQN